MHIVLYSPLHHFILNYMLNIIKNNVRLACVKPLDSVQSEPSSNSKKILLNNKCNKFILYVRYKPGTNIFFYKAIH